MLHPGYDEGKLKKWRDNLPAGHPKKAPDYPDFIKCFRHNEGETGCLNPATLRRSGASGCS